jgi:hypothetical protein
VSASDGREEDVLDPVWTDRFATDVREDERREGQLLVDALAVALLLAAALVIRGHLL